MKFELDEYKRELSDDEIKADIIRVARELNTDYISIATYKSEGKYSQCAIQHHFGTWKNALTICGLRNCRNKEELKYINNNDYFSDLLRIAAMLNQKTVFYKDYVKYGKYAAGHIFKRFKTWDELLIAAGLQPTGLAKHKVTEQELFDEIERIWIKLGRQPTSTDIIKMKLSKYSIDCYKRCFGGWRKALEAFVEYINEEKPGTEYEPKNTEALQKALVQTLPAPDDTKNGGPEEVKIRHQTPRNINARLRFKVLKRDNFQCCACGASPAKNPGVELQVDHIIPWSKGGETVEENLQTLCSKCNLGKSDVL